MAKKLTEEDVMVDEPVDDESDAELMEKYASQAFGDNQAPINELEYKHNLMRPAAQEVYKDINQDMQLANLTDTDLAFVRTSSELIGQLQYIQETTKLGEPSMINLFRRQRDVVLTSSLSLRGFLREWLATNVQRVKLERKMSASMRPDGGGVKKRWRFNVPNYFE